MGFSLKKSSIPILSIIAFLLFSFVIHADKQDSSQALSGKKLAALVEQFNQLTNQLLSHGSTQKDLDELFAMYTDNFLYDHPKYGGVYSRGILYNNSLNNIKNGRYDGSYQQQITKVILGENAATIAWVSSADPNKKERMTLLEFDGDKIKFIKEYW